MNRDLAFRIEMIVYARFRFANPHLDPSSLSLYFPEWRKLEDAFQRGLSRFEDDALAETGSAKED